MDCVILAGGIPEPKDSLYTHTQGLPKALIQLGKVTMIEHVIEALVEAESVQKIVVVGIEKIGTQWDSYPLRFIPDQGSMTANALAGAEWLLETNPNKSHALFCTSDIPTLTGPIVDRFIDSCSPFDCAAYYSMVTRGTMEEHFPASGRTFVNLGGVHLAGGDLVVARPDLVESNRRLLQMLANGRKHAYKLAQLVGPSTLLKLLLHRLTIGDIEARAQAIIRYPVKIMISPDAELAMDVDNANHLSLLRQYLGESSLTGD